MDEKQVETLFNDHHMPFDHVKRGKLWKGMQVWEPVFDRPTMIGLPFVVFEDHGKLRFSDPEEAFAYLDFAYPENAHN
jgi:hypothetical protein